MNTEIMKNLIYGILKIMKNLIYGILKIMKSGTRAERAAPEPRKFAFMNHYLLILLLLPYSKMLNI